MRFVQRFAQVLLSIAQLWAPLGVELSLNRLGADRQLRVRIGGLSSSEFSDSSGGHSFSA
jgi:hypothetical protein